MSEARGRTAGRNVEALLEGEAALRAHDWPVTSANATERSVRRPRTLWEQGQETGYGTVALGLALSLTALVVDVALTGDIGSLFDLAFVTLCVALALRVRRLDFFVVGVLPPLLMASTFVLVAITDPDRLGRPGDGVIQATITGLSHHSLALLAGYALCLLVLLVRQWVMARRDRTS